MSNESESKQAPRFERGATVRVRSGATDPNYPDIPLGGYTGRIEDLDADNDPPLYLLEWDGETLEEMPDALKIRSERDGFDWETMWLAETDLEEITGGLVPIEQPTNLVPQPLNLEDPEDRIRHIFGLTSDDELPEPSPESLKRFHEHLESHLRLPSDALVLDGLFGQSVEFTDVKLLRLVDPSEADPEVGLLAEIEQEGETQVQPLFRILVPDSAPGHRALMEYNFWFSMFAVDLGEGASWETPFPQTRAGVAMLLLRFTAYGAGLGAALGSMLAAIESTYTGMLVGASILGVLGFLLFSRMRAITATPGQGQPSAAAGLLGAILGGFLGGVIGILAVGFLGTIPGAIAGSLLGKGLAALGQKPLGDLGWSVLGACIGGTILAFRENQPVALEGAKRGAIAGCAAMVALVVVFLVVLVARQPTDEGPPGM